MATVDELTPVLATQVTGADIMYVGLPTDPDPDRQATINQMRDVFLADNVVTNAKLRDSLGLSVIGRAANSTGDPADITAASDGHVLRRSGTTLGFGQVATAGIGDLQVTTAKIGDSQVTTAKIGDSQVTDVKVASGLSASKLTTGTLPAARIGQSSINPDKTSFMNLIAQWVYMGSVSRLGTTAAPTRLPSGWTVAKAGSAIRLTTGFSVADRERWVVQVTSSDFDQTDSVPRMIWHVNPTWGGSTSFDVLGWNVGANAYGFWDFTFVAILLTP
jgi:hypothetical protein